MALVRYVLEWDSGSDPVSGRLIAANASARPFTGWLEFLTIVEAERRRGVGPGDASGGAGRDPPRDGGEGQR